MDISEHFSLEDFLAYLFPGVVGSVGIYAILLLTPLQGPLSQLPNDVFTGVILLVVGYIVGVFLSGISEMVFGKFESYKDKLPFEGDANKPILKAFQQVFDAPKVTEKKWSKEHFYACRSLIGERMPSTSPALKRQSSLRQLRINLLPSLVIWCGAGIGWGIRYWLSSETGMGIGLIVASVVLSAAFMYITVDRARSNERREVREVLTAFLAGYQSGTFDKEKRKEK